MRRNQKITKAIREYNYLLKEYPKLRILAENLEFLVDDLQMENVDPAEEIKLLKSILRKKKLDNKDLEVKLISCWIKSVEYPKVDEEILKLVN